MPEPRETPESPLTEAQVSDLLTRLRRVRDNATLMDERGATIDQLRSGGFSWRQIADLTGVPLGTAHRWWKAYTARA